MIHLFQLYHRTITCQMTRTLILAGANPNLRTNRGNDVFDALLHPRSFTPSSWDGYATACFLLNGDAFWRIMNKLDVELYIVKPDRIGHLHQLISNHGTLTSVEKEQLKGKFYTVFRAI